MTTLKLPKKDLQALGNWLASLSLTGKQSRARTRFISLLQEALTRFEADRKAILEEICNKNEDGTPKIVKDEKTGAENYDIPDNKLAEFNKEVNDLYGEDAELTGPETTPIFLLIKDIVLNYDGKIAPSEAVAYNNWCEAFEAYSVTSE
jgi:hypothetical protein